MKSFWLCIYALLTALPVLFLIAIGLIFQALEMVFNMVKCLAVDGIDMLLRPIAPDMD